MTSLKIQPEYVEKVREAYGGLRRYPGLYRITDGIFQANIGGIDALDALIWYAMPTKADYGKFTYDPEADVARFMDMVSVTAVPKVKRAGKR